MSHPSIPRLVMYRPGRSGGLPLTAGCYCDRKTGPIEGPRRITRGGWPEEPVAERRLGGSTGALLDRGSIVRLLLHKYPWARRPEIHREVCFFGQNVNSPKPRNRSLFQRFNGE